MESRGFAACGCLLPRTERHKVTDDYCPFQSLLSLLLALTAYVRRSFLRSQIGLSNARTLGLSFLAVLQPNTDREGTRAREASLPYVTSPSPASDTSSHRLPPHPHCFSFSTWMSKPSPTYHTSVTPADDMQPPAASCSCSLTTMVKTVTGNLGATMMTTLRI